MEAFSDKGKRVTTVILPAQLQEKALRQIKIHQQVRVNNCYGDTNR